MMNPEQAAQEIAYLESSGGMEKLKTWTKDGTEVWIKYGKNNWQKGRILVLALDQPFVTVELTIASVPRKQHLETVSAIDLLEWQKQKTTSD